MLFEAEVVPLFIWGVCIVSLLELIVGCWMLKKDKKSLYFLLAML